MDRFWLKKCNVNYTCNHVFFKSLNGSTFYHLNLWKSDQNSRQENYFNSVSNDFDLL